MNEAIWPDSIQVSEWYFKPPDTSNNINVAAASGEATASAAAAVAATSADADVAVDMAMSDDTIVAAYDNNSINDGN